MLFISLGYQNVCITFSDNIKSTATSVIKRRNVMYPKLLFKAKVLPSDKRDLEYYRVR